MTRANHILFSAALFFSGFLGLSAVAKPVTLEWDPIEGAVQYEIEIENKGKPILSTVLDRPGWTGELGHGFHAYRIRAIDAATRPGTWSDAFPVVVMPPEPQPLSPKVEQTVRLYSNQDLVLEWERSEGTNRYFVELKRGEESVFSGAVGQTELRLGQVPSGAYTWRVRALINPDDEYSGLLGRKWFSVYSKPVPFLLKRIKLAAPVLIFPVGETWPPNDGKVAFQWKPVPGAVVYEIRVRETRASDSTRSGANQSDKIYRTEENGLLVHVGERGHFSWRVRALGQATESERSGTGMRQTSNADDSASESQAEFYFQKNDLSNYESLSVSLTTGYSLSSYSVNDSVRNIRGAVSPTGFPLRVGASRTWPSMWGIDGSFQSLFFGIDGKTHLNTRFDVAGHYRYDLSTGWYVNVGLGGQMREVTFFSPNQGGATSSVSNVSLLGMTAGAEITKYLSSRWGVGFESKLFFPFAQVSGTRGTLVGHGPHENLMIGGGAQYMGDNHFSYNLGFFWDRNTTNLAAAGGGNSDTIISSDIFYLLIGLVYRFGAD